MILTAHIIAGTAIATKVNNLWLLPFACVAGHFILDSIPHAEYAIGPVLEKKFGREYIKTLAKIGFDFLVGFFAVLYFGSKILPLKYIMIATIFSVLPDFLTFVSLFYKNRGLKLLGRIHQAVHFHKKLSAGLRQKFSVQAVVVLALLWAIAKA